MNRIVREHYPVEKLPEDLREGLPAGRKVTVTLEEEGVDEEGLSERLAAILANPRPMTIDQARALAGNRSTSTEEAVTRIRSLRDEWDQ
ncbi:hypothetical protein [Ancylobacter radicis]|uniref:Antitoxin n=1 Tax=Ancylobacter radicis TaxID=2836179 RepID=A0ABS5R9L5_9HYPH|nr:hypothetical protein [Ancylobacter radicis]MBS9478350.1 hypothetical protein [Ancylobacter radicis]